MTYSILYRGFTDGKQTHQGRLKIEADDREDAKFELNHSVIDGIPEGVEVRFDGRTWREEKE